VLVVLGPVAGFLVTKRLCLALQTHERHVLEEGEETGVVRWAFVNIDPSSAETPFRGGVRECGAPKRS